MDIEKVINLARLSLSDSEKELFVGQMDSILSYFNALEEVNTEGVESMVTPIENPNVFRKDKAEKWNNIEKALENSAQTKGNLFQVPPVV